MEPAIYGCQHFRDVSWELLLNVPVVADITLDGKCTSACSLANTAHNSPVIDLGRPDPTYETAASSIVFLLVSFIVVTAVSSDEENLISNSNPLAAWIRFHLQQLRQLKCSPETASSVFLSPSDTPFPIAELAAFHLQHFAAYKSLTSDLEAAKNILQLVLKNEIEAEGQAGLDPEYLCSQILIRALLCLRAPSTLLRTREGDLYSNAGLVAASLAMLLNTFSAWSMDMVVEAAQGVAHIREAQFLVVEMAVILLKFAQQQATQIIGSHLRGTALMYRDVSSFLALPYALMNLRYLAAAGARKLFGANKSKFLFYFCCSLEPRGIFHILM